MKPTPAQTGKLPACPVVLSKAGKYWTGLTKREAFAKAAMQGMLAADVSYTITHVTMSEMAVKQADSLLAELAKGLKGDDDE